MRRSGLQRRTPLKQGGSLKRSRLGHASVEQKAKVWREGARLWDGAVPVRWDEEHHLEDAEVVDPAHIVARAQGGCDDEDCVVPLPRRLHRLYDNGELDILPYLTLEEQAHAVSHLGILGALKRTTGEVYVPERSISGERGA